MKDWVTDLENKRRRESEEAEAESNRPKKPGERGYKEWRLRMDSLEFGRRAWQGYEKHGARFREIYTELANYAKRAQSVTDVGFETKSNKLEEKKDIYHSYPYFSIVGSDARELMFMPQADELKVSVFIGNEGQGDGRFRVRSTSFLIPLREVNHEQISVWVKWLATGNGPSNLRRENERTDKDFERWVARDGIRSFFGIPIMLGTIPLALIFGLVKGASYGWYVFFGGAVLFILLVIIGRADKGPLKK